MPMDRIARSEKGSVLLLVVFIASLMAFIPIGAELLRNSRKQVELQAHAGAQALNVARAGLTDAVAWFRRQPSQPVKNISFPDTAFFPRQATDDTDDESIGLVKEYRLGETNNLYARYEIVRQSTSAANNDHAVHDITRLRVNGGTNGEGLAWFIESVGYVYRRKDAGVAYNVAPNQIVGRARVATEIRRVGITAPSAAVVANERRDGQVNGNSRIIGGANGWGAYCYVRPVNNPNNWGDGTRTTGGLGNVFVNGTGAISQDALFGVSDNELKMMADFNVSSTSELPETYPTMALVYINGNAVFNNVRPLRGGGILVVKGDLVIAASANALFSGVIFVDGDIVMNGPAYVSGTVIVTDQITMNSGSETCTVQYDPDILSSLQQEVGQYRENKGTYHVFSALKS